MTTRYKNVELQNLTIPLTDIMKCSENCGCCIAPFTTLENESSSVQKNAETDFSEENNHGKEKEVLSNNRKSEMINSSDNGKDSDLEKAKTDSFKENNLDKEKETLPKVRKNTKISSSSDSEKDSDSEKIKTDSSKENNYDDGEEILPKIKKRTKRSNSDKKDSDSEELKKCSPKTIRSEEIEEKNLMRKQKNKNKICNSSSEENSDLEEVKTDYPPQNNCNKKISKIKKRTKRLSKSDSEKDSDFEEIKRTSSKSVISNKEDDLQIKKCSVLLYDIQSRLCSHTININNVSLLTDKKCTEINDDCVLRNITDDEKMANNIFLKTKDNNENRSEIISNSGNEEDSHLEETENISFKTNLKDGKEEKSEIILNSGSEENSDLKEAENIFSKIKDDTEKTSEIIFSSGSEEDSDLEKIKTAVSKAIYFDKGEDIQLKKCSVLLQDIGINLHSNRKMSDEELIKQKDFENDKKKEKKSRPRYESQERRIESDDASPEFMDAESEEECTLSVLKSKKKLKSDSSKDLMFDKKKKKRESSFSSSSDKDSDEKTDKKDSMKEKDTRKMEKNKKKLFNEEESGESWSRSKSFRKRKELKTIKFSSSDEDEVSNKEMKSSSRMKQRTTKSRDNSFIKVSESEDKKSIKSIEKAKSYSSDDSIIPMRKRGEKSSAFLDEDDRDEKENKEMKEKRILKRRRNSSRRVESNENKVKQVQRIKLRKKERVSYYINSSSEDDPLEENFQKEKSSFTDKNQDKNVVTDSTYKESVDDNVSLGIGNEEEKCLKDLKPKKKEMSDSSDDFLFSKKKKRRNSIISNDENEIKERPIRKMEKWKLNKRNDSSTEEKSDSSEKIGIFKIYERFKLFESSSSEDEYFRKGLEK